MTGAATKRTIDNMCDVQYCKVMYISRCKLLRLIEMLRAFSTHVRRGSPVSQPD